MLSLSVSLIGGPDQMLKKHDKFCIRTALAFVLGQLLFVCGILAEDCPCDQTGINAVSQQFASPDTTCYPWVYWFWNNGNITREGITADLEAMQRVGVKGVLIMEVGQGAPVGPVNFMSDEWKELWQFMIQEAERLGIEVNMNNDAGWNGSGGVWIKPDEAMQILSWSEVQVTSEQKEIVLPQPAVRMDYYRDIAVLAFPTPKDQTTRKAPGPDSHVRATQNDSLVERNTILDLTDKMDADGRLDWSVPDDGNWTVLRMGHTCKGIMVAPAPTNGTGLECDKLSVKGTDAAFNGQIKILADQNRDQVGTVFLSTHIDSWENGSQNWTENMREEFQTRRQYDLFNFLPVFAGYVVDSPEITDRFFWDFRRTVSEMVMQNHVLRMRELANQNGLKLSIEAYGSPCDHIQYGGIADEPMGEFWIGGGAIETCRGMASAGHLYGKQIIGAEAFTAANQERWLEYPGSIKSLGDRAFCEGINRFVFHRYSFQPWKDVRPGLMMGPWGIHYERTQTWWELTPAWHEYLARCQYMLRQGCFVSDIWYSEPENSPSGFTSHPHSGYNWDQCGTDAILQMTVRDGRLYMPCGQSARILVIPSSEQMTPELAAKLTELVKAGALVIASRPKAAFGLTNYPDNDARVQELAAELWGDSQEESGERSYGLGKIIWGKTPEEVLQARGVIPDMLSDCGLNWIHRSLPDADIYFVANSSPMSVTSQVIFRATGTPELWNPVTGRILPVATRSSVKDGTQILLALDESESVFVVFRHDRPMTESDNLVAFAVDNNWVGKKDLMKLASPDIKIVRATYGPEGDAARTIDVTNLLQQIFDAGEDQFTVGRLARDFDPARNVVKTLNFEYLNGDNAGKWSGTDPEVLTRRGLTGFVKVKILEAKYGPEGDDARTIDVTSLLQQKADSGEDNFRVTEMAREKDPAYGVVKTLVFTYEIDGNIGTWKGTDSGWINFDQLRLQDKLVTASVDTEGCPALDLWQSGNYQFEFVSGKKESLQVELPEPQTITGLWKVRFPEKEVMFDTLVSWSDVEDDDIRYFSGTAEYEITFRPDASLFAEGQRIYLDLGRVEALAELKLNEFDFGVLWTNYKTIDVTDLLNRDADNKLTVRVTNLWPNRLIGDAQFEPEPERQENGTLSAWPEWLQKGEKDPSGRQTFCMWELWRKTDKLQPSGLMGPVRLCPARQIVR